MENKRTSTIVKIKKEYLNKLKSTEITNKTLLASILATNIDKYKDVTLSEILNYSINEAAKIQVSYTLDIAQKLDEIAPLIKVRSTKASYIINKELERL